MNCFMRCQPTLEDQTGERFYVMAMIELTIYGHTIDRFTREHYPDDWHHTMQLREQGIEWGCWHSVAASDGEIGSNRVDGLRPILFETFAQARDQGWPYDNRLTTLAPVAAVGFLDDAGRFQWDWSSLDSTLGAKNQG